MNYTRAFIKYTKELSSDVYNPLSKEEERDLIIHASSGSIEARDCIIKAHLRFVVYLLRSFKIPTGVDLMDVIQAGNLGLLSSISKFNTDKFDCRISTYAQYYIKWFISKELGIYDKSISIIEFPEGTDFEDVVKDYETVEVPEIEEKVYQDIYEYLSNFLNTRELRIVSLFYGLEYPFKSLTLREVGSMFHLNSETIRQIKEVAMDKIKEKQEGILNLS
jgi:RNA polymerase sigma factor (sigma-70 family)